MNPKQKINTLIDEIRSYELKVIEGVITKKLLNYHYEDYETLPTEVKYEVHYLYDILFFVTESKNKGEYMSWSDKWKQETHPNRYEISGKHSLDKSKRA